MLHITSFCEIRSCILHRAYSDREKAGDICTHQKSPSYPFSLLPLPHAILSPTGHAAPVPIVSFCFSFALAASNYNTEKPRLFRFFMKGANYSKEVSRFLVNLR